MNRQLTIDEYFTLLKKNELNLVENHALKTFETYIQDCQKYEPYLVDDTRAYYNDFIRRLSQLSHEENITRCEQSALQKFSSLIPKEEEVTTLTPDNDGPKKVLTKAGYIDSAIILAMLLNLGFIVAMTFLKK